MLLAFLLPGVVGFMTILLLVATLPDRRLHLPANSVTSVGSLVRESIDSFRFDPRRHPDFSWAWLSRFLLGVGCSCINTFQPFYLVDRLGRSLDEVPALVFQSMAVQSTLVVLCSLLSGKLSDFLGHRKAFVFFGAAAYATGLWIVASAHSYGVFLAGIVLTGIGQGAYYAVDLALITEVLPDQQRDAAKDLGILNIANALPQVIAPAIGAGILSLAASNYQWLYLVGGAITFASACAILPVRSVR